MSNHFHLGPYIRCKQELVLREKEYEGCAKCKKEFSSKNFCETCGSTKTRYKVTVNEPKVSHWDLNSGSDVDRIAIQYCETAMYPKRDKFVYYINNSVPIPGLEHRAISRYEEPVAHEIKPAVIDYELALFKQHMVYDIERCEKAYGKENVSILWGLLIAEER